jgi:ornithine cyclodeaminase/alanine dehydrogenase-like protein (mu-crystallin family)
MSTLILDQEQVKRLLPMKHCITLMREALSTLARGASINPLRFVFHPNGTSRLLSMMPAYANASELLGMKIVTVSERGQGSQYDAHQGLVVLFDPQHGTPSAIFEASSITAIRTAAVSAVATDLLAGPQAGDLAILGSGAQDPRLQPRFRQSPGVRRLRGQFIGFESGSHALGARCA